jgi:hypothetical protein
MLEVVEKKDAGIRNFITGFAESAKAQRSIAYYNLPVNYNLLVIIRTSAKG